MNNSVVSVLTPHGRRLNVKIQPNETVLKVGYYRSAPSPRTTKKCPAPNKTVLLLLSSVHRFLDSRTSMYEI